MEIDIEDELKKLYFDLQRWNKMLEQAKINIHRLSGAISLLENLKKKEVKEVVEDI